MQKEGFLNFDLLLCFSPTLEEFGVANRVYLKYLWIDGSDWSWPFPKFDDRLYEHADVGFVHIDLAFQLLHTAGNVLACRERAAQLDEGPHDGNVYKRRALATQYT